MTPVAALLGGAATAGYVPILRAQIRDGKVGIPFGSINPITVARADHPVAFAVCAALLGGATGLLLAACCLLLARALLR